MGSITAKRKLALIERVFKGEKVARVCREVGVSRKTFYQWLKSYRKSRPQQRIFALSDHRFKRRFSVKTLDPRGRLLIINKAREKEASVVELCRQLEISRKTFYKWKKRFEEKGEVLEALFDARPREEKHWRFISEEKQRLLLELVISHPEHSIRHLSEVLHGLGRAADSVSGNIAEGFGQRHKKEINNLIRFTEKRMTK